MKPPYYFLLGLFFLVHPAFSQRTPSIIPLPQIYTAVQDSFRLNDKVFIVCEDNSLLEKAYYLQKELLKTKKIAVSFGNSKQFPNIVLTKQPLKNKLPEAYSLQMSKNSISIKANDKEGIFNGISSLLQLVLTSKNDYIKCWNIEDYPVFGWRGVMIDESRHFFGTKKIKAWDEMANVNLPTEKTIIFWWRHDKENQLKTALDNKYQVVLCPRIPLYFDFVQDSAHVVGRRWAGDFNTVKRVYSFEPKNIISADNLKQVVGMQANLWTETVSSNERFDYMLFPRISALAEAAWSNMKNYDDNLERLKLHFPLYRKDNIYFFNPLNKKDNPEVKR